MKKVEHKQVLIRVPSPLLKQVDAAAKRQSRSRTAEMCLRIAESLKSERIRRTDNGGVSA